MQKHLSVGTNLYHKYLSNITVVEVCEERIKANTSSHGILEFAFYDFGRVLFFDKSHASKTFKTYNNYLEFCEEEQRKKIIEDEENRKKLLEYEEQRRKNLEEEKAQKEREVKRLQEIKEAQKKKKDQEKDQIEHESIFAVEKPSPWDKFSYLDTLMEEVFLNKETLFKIKKEQEVKIKEITERRKIEYLVHFTRIENLQNVLQYGLVPVSMQSKMKVHSLHNDEQRIDSKLDCTSCSIGFPNYKLFYTFREYKFPGTSWAIIVLDKDVLFSPSNIAYYCHTNAAGVFPRVSSVKKLCTASAFENMFCETYNTKENKTIRRSELQISDHITTDPQAEILISDVIDKKFIGCIYFQNQQDIDNFISMNGDSLLKQYDHQIVPEFFNARKDYMFWKKES